MNFHSVNKTHASLSLHHTNDNHQLPNPHNLFRGSRRAENWCPASSYVRHSSAWASPAASLSKFRLTCCANRQLHGYVCFHRQITKYKDIVTIWNKQSWLRLCHVDSWVHRSSPLTLHPSIHSVSILDIYEKWRCICPHSKWLLKLYFQLRLHLPRR